MLFDRFFLLCPYSFPLLFELWAPEWSVGAHSLTNRCTRRHQDYGPQLCYPAALSRCYPVTLLNGQQAPVGRRVPTDSLGTSAVFRSHPPPSVRRAPGGTSLVLQTGYLFECPSLMVSPLTKTGTTIVEGQAVSGDPLTSLRRRVNGSSPAPAGPNRRSRLCGDLLRMARVPHPPTAPLTLHDQFVCLLRGYRGVSIRVATAKLGCYPGVHGTASSCQPQGSLPSHPAALRSPPPLHGPCN